MSCIRTKETNRKDGRAYVQGCKEKIIIGGIMYLYDHRNGAGGAESEGGDSRKYRDRYRRRG